jgi:flagellar biosynthetic protein FliP
MLRQGARRISRAVRRRQCGTAPATPDEVAPQALLPAFLISELKTAFQMGFLIYIPFLILDMVVASVLTSMGMITLPPILISLPFKLMLFVLVDGWNVLTGSLVASFR